MWRSGKILVRQSKHPVFNHRQVLIFSLSHLVCASLPVHHHTVNINNNCIGLHRLFRSLHVLLGFRVVLHIAKGGMSNFSEMKSILKFSISFNYQLCFPTFINGANFVLFLVLMGP